MAELNSSSRNRKETPKVDLTAMVDLAFLLITFFMLTTSLTKQNAMDIVKPDETDDHAQIELPASRTMTILLGKNENIFVTRTIDFVFWITSCIIELKARS